MEGRKQYLDYVRVMATLCVILIHITAKRFYDVSVGSNEWRIISTINGLVRVAVPLFTMISGAIFVNRQVSVKSIYLKYILRLVIAFAFWSVVYASIYSNSF